MSSTAQIVGRRQATDDTQDSPPPPPRSIPELPLAFAGDVLVPASSPIRLQTCDPALLASLDLELAVPGQPLLLFAFDEAEPPLTGQASIDRSHPPALGNRTHRGLAPLAAWCVGAIVLVVTVVCGVAAVHENSVAAAWQSEYQKAVAQLVTAQSSIASLNTQVAAVTGQIGGLDTHLAAQSTAKEKALDQNSALSQLIGQEQAVSAQLNTCVTDLQKLIDTVSGDLNSANYTDPAVARASQLASSDCSKAQSADQALQSGLSGATG